MARSILTRTITDTTGIIQQGALVTVYEEDGTTLLAQAMYAALSGGTALANPLTTNNLGQITVYVETAQRVVLSTGGSTYKAEFDPNPSDLVRLSTVFAVPGDLAYANAAGSATRLAIGTNGYLLEVVGGVPAWVANPATGRNLLMNATGRTKQLSTLPTTDNAYGFDGWRLLMENANGFTLSQETANLPVPGPRHGMKHVVGSGNNGKGGACQIVPASRLADVAGGVVSFQVKLYATAAIANMRMGVLQWAGTADNGGTIFPDPITTWGADGTNPTPSGSWTFAVTPTNLGVTAAWGTTIYKVENVPISSSSTNVAVLVWCDDRTTTQTTDYFIITDAQLEVGAACLAIERVDPRVEMLDALSWYERIYPSLQGDVVAAENMAYFHTFSAPKWRAPTVTKVGTFLVSNVGQPASFVRAAGVSDLAGLEIIAAASGTGFGFFVPTDATSYFEVDARI